MRRVLILLPVLLALILPSAFSLGAPDGEEAEAGAGAGMVTAAAAGAPFGDGEQEAEAEPQEQQPPEKVSTDKARLLEAIEEAAAEEETGPLRIAGYMKSLLSWAHLGGSWPGDERALLDDFSRIRLMFEADITRDLMLVVDYENYLVWGDSVAYAGKAEGDLTLPLFTLVDRPHFTLMDLGRTYWRESNLLAAHGLDRLYLDWNPGPVEVVLGRQEVIWGAGYLWSPIDLFAPFAPAQIDKEEKDGVDMARLVWPLPHDFLLTLLHAPRRDPESGDVENGLASSGAFLEREGGAGYFSALAARHRRHQVAGLAGYRFFGEHYTLRGEATWADVDEELKSRFRQQTQLLLGLDRRFGEDFLLAVEGWYDSIGGTGPSDYLEVLADPYFQQLVAAGEIFNLARLYTGLIVQYEQPAARLPWQALLFTIFNLDDGSFYLAPRLGLTPRPGLTLTLGAALPQGSGFSEYGSYTLYDPAAGQDDPLPYPDQLYAYVKWEF